MVLTLISHYFSLHYLSFKHFASQDGSLSDVPVGAAQQFFICFVVMLP